MTIICFIRYEIDPFQRDAFQQYATNWARIIPRCGGLLVAQSKRFILCEERTFLEVVGGTFGVPSTSPEDAENCSVLDVSSVQPSSRR
jgi:hypothetical protein